MKQSVGTAEARAKLDKFIDELMAKKNRVSRGEMFNRDQPYGRFFDEFELKDNCTYLKPRKELPTLIVQGGADAEVPMEQARTWKEQLPEHPISLFVKEGADHTFTIAGGRPMAGLAQAMDEWLASLR